jgi:hypothetical protein
MNHDRRQHPRLIPDSALLVSLGQSKRGFLSDISEGGMAFDGFPPKGGNNVIFLAFDLPEGGGSIEAIAEVVWTCDSLRRTGVRFLELADASRRRLGTWISSRVFTLNSEETPQKDTRENRDVSEGPKGSTNWVSFTRTPDLPLAPPPQTFKAAPQLDPISEAVPVRTAPQYRWEDPRTARSREALANQIRLRHQKPPYSLGVVLAIVVVSAACVSLGYYLPGMVYGRRVTGVTTTSESPVAFSTQGSVLTVSQPAATKSVSAPPPEEDTGFVLQVAAMSHPENADALVEKLQQKHFPAFVSNRGNAAIYRVDVGPYSDAAYARSVQDELKTAGFQVILRRQLP